VSEITGMEALVRRGKNALEHYGVKGMKWGVRKSRSGGGTVKVKYRPTYTTDERRQAQAGVKAAKAAGGKQTSKDKEGFDQTRLAQLRTPQRRVVNAAFGTKVSNITKATTLTSTLSTGLLVGDPAITLAVAAAGGVANIGVGAYDAQKIFFTNLAKNPGVKLKTDLSPSDLAKYNAGKTITKNILSKKGSATVSLNKNGSTVTVKDREGRSLGSQTSTKATRRLDQTPKPPKPTKKS
jgi:hypothetical protein